jgi:thiol-disulfide isomerase/thioredoxin
MRTSSPLTGEGVSRRLVILAGASLALPALAQGRIEHFTGSNAPAFPAWQALDLQGRSNPVPATGKPAVVNFWATWCEPCRTEMPLLQQMGDFYSDRLVLQAVDFKERAATVQGHVRRSGWTVPVLLDPTGAGAAAWGVKIFPTTIGFDAQGRPRWRVTGQYDWSTPEAGHLVEGLWR